MSFPEGLLSGTNLRIHSAVGIFSKLWEQAWRSQAFQLALKCRLNGSFPIFLLQIKSYLETLISLQHLAILAAFQKDFWLKAMKVAQLRSKAIQGILRISEKVIFSCKLNSFSFMTRIVPKQ